MDVGSLPEILSAIGTLGALVAASVAARSALRTNKQQTLQLQSLEDNQNRQRVREAREQASAVAAWIGIFDELPSFRFINSSGLPIYDFTAWVATPDELFEVDYTFVPPSTEMRWLDRVRSRIIVDSSGFPPGYWEGLLDRRELLAAITFRDCSDRWWLRDFQGVLEAHDSGDIAKEEARRRFDGLSE